MQKIVEAEKFSKAVDWSGRT